MPGVSPSKTKATGDAERASGRIPNSMMDRRQPDQQAASQGEDTDLQTALNQVIQQLEELRTENEQLRANQADTCQRS
uniref:Uncharacterized protein n=1 Tax=Timema bartmani TaxID=61472 RepID=A0A7R9F8C6_9NEOP|nr:unnamed protein product [Timema bartmani]